MKLLTARGFVPLDSAIAVDAPSSANMDKTAFSNGVYMYSNWFFIQDWQDCFFQSSHGSPKLGLTQVSQIYNGRRANGQ